MKIVRANIPVSQQAATSMPAALWSTAKMLVAAILCGLAVSFVAAGIAIVLAGEAEARLFQKETTLQAPSRTDDSEENDDSAPKTTPGMLLIGDGCDGLSLQAIERDWQVRIDGNRINVRVMQAFQLPAESAEVATFHVQLSQGARLLGLNAQTQGKDLAGRLLSGDEYDRLTPDEYLKLTRNRLLVSHASRGTVMTSPIMNLRADEVVTIQYMYEIASGSEDGGSSFKLFLDAEDDKSAGISASVADESIAPKHGIRGAVWVEWVGSRPTQVMGLPVDADLETTKSRVDGLSWAVNDIRSGAFLQLAWSLG